MCELADIIVSYKTYPHVDMRVAGHQAASLLQATLVGEIRPRTILARRPMLEEVNGGRTDIGPITLGKQRPGSMRVLDSKEIGALYKAVGM